ncbi:GAF and ANTAR domain-containing protein [Quadrisphaera sp. DSM 44207]|uniref:GAF and ANTAR domain-containing protein n=1 Tax=Quadrisphaera sp. DSM 44207 TaxID=1881057 RepID=UPI000891C314|nr:GAF and ANTAR domain-containing protein [Quadrisphaera sp. DSM 44207]SDQ69957.1 GAF domain-containing protein [Quadrisphaera sp. DSM 44207]
MTDTTPDPSAAEGAGDPAGSAPGPPMDLQQALAELGRIPLWDTPLSQVLARVADLAAVTIPGVDEVSVTLVEGEEARSVAFTGDLAVSLDERQYAQGFGPCMDAALGGQAIGMPDLASEDRYPDFVAVARRAGVTSAASVGMPVPTRLLGGLNLYSTGGRSLDEESLEVAEIFASYAAVAVANAALLSSTAQLADQMRAAMSTRADIEQAKGIIVARTGCTAEEAFAVLAAQSQRTHRKVNEIAAELVAEAQGQPRRRPR